VRWQTEITTWEPPHKFVDEQKRGPYRAWIHEHRFETRDGGTQMTDTVRYAVPGGKFIEKLFVGRDIKRIFEYRRVKLQALFQGA
jgi:ligand-binding SRPBCC domain-containing protein